MKGGKTSAKEDKDHSGIGPELPCPARPETASNRAAAERRTLTIDWDLYGEYLDDADLTDDQKRELIETLWSIVVAFVDLGFGVHPVQRVSDACGQNGKGDALLASAIADVVSSPESLPKNTFEKAARGPRDTRAERKES